MGPSRSLTPAYVDGPHRSVRAIDLPALVSVSAGVLGGYKQRDLCPHVDRY